MLYSGCARCARGDSGKTPGGGPATTFGGVPSHSINVRQSLLSASTNRFARAKSASSTKTANSSASWPPFEALKIARERGLDLVEVSPNAVPPGLPHPGLRPLPLREGKERPRRQEKAEGHHGQGGQVLRHRRRARLPDQENQAVRSSPRATRSRPACASAAARWPTANWATPSSTG